MDIELAKARARMHIRELAQSKKEEAAMISGMLILEDALNDEL